MEEKAKVEEDVMKGGIDDRDGGESQPGRKVDR